jgi:hypothetical protein
MQVNIRVINIRVIVVLDRLLNKIDVCLMSETQFTKQSFIKFRGYTVYHTPHPGNAARGGNAVIVKENIYHNEEVKFEIEDIQATTLNIKTKKYNIAVVSLYSPPRHNIKSERYVELLKNREVDSSLAVTSMQNTPIWDRDL